MTQLISWDNKSVGGGDPDGKWRAADANQVKTVVNANATPPVRTVNTASPTAILVTDGVILFDTSSTAISIDLPLANLGTYAIPFKDIGCNSSSNNITFNRAGSDTITDINTGQTSSIIATNGASGYFKSNGTDTWHLFI